MDAETAAALEESIAHWKRMREEPLGKDIPGVNDCALCGLFYDDAECSGCPVEDRTGDQNCEGSPYAVAHSAWNAHYSAQTPETIAAWRKAADAEIAFLESLREALTAGPVVEQSGGVMACNCGTCLYGDQSFSESPCNTCDSTFDNGSGYQPEDKGQEPKRGRSDMQTYRYEIVAAKETDKDGVEVKAAIRIAHGDGLLEEPKTLDLLQKHHEAIVKAGREYTDVQVNVRPFCR